MLATMSLLEALMTTLVMESALTVLLASVTRAVPIAPVTTALQLPPLTVTTADARCGDRAVVPTDGHGLEGSRAVTSVVSPPERVSEAASGMVTTELDPETVTSVYTPASVTTLYRLALLCMRPAGATLRPPRRGPASARSG